MRNTCVHVERNVEMSLVAGDIATDNGTLMDGEVTEMMLEATVINAVCTFVSSGVMLADTVAVYALLKCKRIPTFARIFSINFLLGDAVGSTMFVACQVALLCFGIKQELMHHFRTISSGFALTIAMESVALLALDRVLALKISLRYASFVSKVKGLSVVVTLWCTNLVTLAALLAFGIVKFCPSAQFCDLWSATRSARVFLIGLVVTSQTVVTVSYFYVLKVARKHERSINAMTNRTCTQNKYPQGTGMIPVSERQFSTTQTLLKIVLAFIICHVPICVQMVMFETTVDTRNNLPRNVLNLVSYVGMQANSIISLRIYVARFKECQLVLMMLIKRFCKSDYTQRIEQLRISVFNIIVSTDNVRPNRATTVAVK